MKKICPFCRKELSKAEIEKRELEKFPVVCDNCVETTKQKIQKCQKLMEKISL